jgi:hypothetical protein
MCVTNKRKNNLFGYLVAAGGFLMVMLTMSLLISKTLLLDWMVLVLVAAGIFLVALGMYVVHPKETKEYLDTAGEAIDHLPVRFNRGSRASRACGGNPSLRSGCDCPPSDRA